MATLTFPKNAADAKRLSRLAGQGRLHRIRQGIYIDTADEADIRQTLENQWVKVATYLLSHAVPVARTAVELKPAEGRLYLVTPQAGRRTVKVGHLQFVLEPGDVELGVEPFHPDMKRSNQSRYCLENLSPSRGNPASKKTLGRDWVEAELVKVVLQRGENALNALRDEARHLAQPLGLDEEYEQLGKMVSAILATHPLEGVLHTRSGIAQAKGEPFDALRLERFHRFAAYLEPLDLTSFPFAYSKSAWRNLCFFESYFSNYIEGTEFTISEAESIVFEQREIYDRHQDSHDVLAHMELTSDMAEMKRVPQSANELISLLQARHAILLAARPDKRPGEFKQKANKAGSTLFVEPGLVEGTLVQGFPVYQGLPAGIKRALFMHFLISECHPFDDGNGRLSRLMMNAELVSCDQYKIIVPTVHRESYLNGLKNATRLGQFRTVTKAMHQLLCYTASLPWEEYGDAKAALQSHAADKEPDEGIPRFNEVISRLGGVYPAG
jgi:hypothetical protein